MGRTRSAGYRSAPDAEWLAEVLIDLEEDEELDREVHLIDALSSAFPEGDDEQSSRAEVENSRYA